MKLRPSVPYRSSNEKSQTAHHRHHPRRRPLVARRPYDLRHAAVSTWLNASGNPAQVAEWAGHSVDVLLRTYAKCIAGQQEEAKRRILEATQPTEAPQPPHGDPAPKVLRDARQEHPATPIVNTAMAVPSRPPATEA